MMLSVVSRNIKWSFSSMILLLRSINFDSCEKALVATLYLICASLCALVYNYSQNVFYYLGLTIP